VNIKDMPAYDQMMVTPDAVPIAVVDPDGEPHTRSVVCSGVLCLVHQRWDVLVWDGMRVGPLCCFQP
jgi:hypothetical protein